MTSKQRQEFFWGHASNEPSNGTLSQVDGLHTTQESRLTNDSKESHNLAQYDGHRQVIKSNPNRKGSTVIAKCKQKYHETFIDEPEAISADIPSDMPSDMVDIEGNVLNQEDLNFGQDEDECSSIDGNLEEQRGGYPSHNIHNPSRSGANEMANSDDGCVSNNSTSSIEGQRKKSILSNRTRYTRSGGGCSSNMSSFNGSVGGGSSMISDGKIGSINISSGGSFNSQFYNNFYSRAAQRQDFQRYTRGPYAPLDRNNSTSTSSAHSSTMFQHYYPEGGWGFVVLATALFSHALLCGFLLTGGPFSVKIGDRFGHDLRIETTWLTSLSLGLSLFLSPVWIAICKKRSTRLTAVFGGLVASLGCLFTSFASQFHQLYFSYGIFLSVGVGLTRDASMLMVGQYFKRRRDLVEILLVSGSGVGILLMSFFIEFAISSAGWRLGLQGITGSLALTFFLGSCYRSASLYHPQRRAILHLKNQKRKIKDKDKKSDKPPFLDFSCLTSGSLQALLVSCFCTACGFYAPLFHLANQTYDEGVDDIARLFLYVYIGSGWIIGSGVCGIMSLQRNEDCRISKLYLLQVANLIIGSSILALANIQDYSGLVTFAWPYGIGLGGYSYMLKCHAYDKARARMFPTAWSFIQGVQGAGICLGAPVIGYLSRSFGWKIAYLTAAGLIFLGTIVMIISGVGKHRLSRNKSRTSSMKTCETTDSLQSPSMRRISFTFPDEQQSPRISKDGRSSCSVRSVSGNNEQPMMTKELTRISEEGILDAN